MGAGVADAKVAKRIVHQLGGRRREPHRQGRAGRVAQPGRVGGVGHHFAPSQANLDGPALLHQRAHPARDPLGVGSGRRGRPSRQLVQRQRPQHAQQVVGLVGVPGLATGNQPLKLQLDVGNDAGVEQLPQLLDT